MGARLLRMNLLAPITGKIYASTTRLLYSITLLIVGQAAIEARLDAVEELVQTEDKFLAVRDALKTVNKLDLDKLISAVSVDGLFSKIC